MVFDINIQLVVKYKRIFWDIHHHVTLYLTWTGYSTPESSFLTSSSVHISIVMQSSSLHYYNSVPTWVTVALQLSHPTIQMRIRPRRVPWDDSPIKVALVPESLTIWKDSFFRVIFSIGCNSCTPINHYNILITLNLVPPDSSSFWQATDPVHLHRQSAVLFFNLFHQLLLLGTCHRVHHLHLLSFP